MKPLGRVKCEWSSDFAYVIGLLATDGNLSPSGRHINFTSKDEELCKHVKEILGLNNKIGRKARGGESEKKYFVFQFGDVLFYKFLEEIGLSQNKSKTLESVDVPEKYFFDFLRGVIDGDGSIITYSHPESRHRQLRLRIYSASLSFLKWLKESLTDYTEGGYIIANRRVMQLEFAKKDAIHLLGYVYYPGFQYCLTRKFDRAKGYIGWSGGTR